MIKRDKFAEVPGSPNIIRDAIIEKDTQKYRVEFRVNGSDLTPDIKDWGDLDLDAASDAVLDELRVRGIAQNTVFEWYPKHGFHDITEEPHDAA